MIAHKSAVFGENGLVFDSYEEFASTGGVGHEGKVLTFVNVEYKSHGTLIHSLESITAASLTMGPEGGIDLKDIILASSCRDAVLDSQRGPMYEWVMSWAPKDAWNRSNRYVKRLLH